MPLNNFNLVHCIFEFNGDSYVPKFLTYANVCCNFRLPPYVDVNLFLQPQYGLETCVSDYSLYMFFGSADFIVLVFNWKKWPKISLALVKPPTYTRLNLAYSGFFRHFLWGLSKVTGNTSYRAVMLFLQCYLLTTCSVGEFLKETDCKTRKIVWKPSNQF